jgi:ribonucleoside-triphosphate reductase
MNVIKRNGDIIPFNGQKIVDAINKAFIDVDGKLYETDTAADIALEIGQKADLMNRPLSVEEIQDMVEDYLMRSERKDVARAYIRYRYKKEVARNVQSDFFDAIEEKLTAKNVQNQNANIDEHSFGGRIGEASGVMTKAYALEHLVSPMARQHHENNEIYIHDLDAYAVGMHNCLSIPFDDLLAKGFNTRQTDVRPANSINTAMQLVAVIFQLQSLQQFGGVSATHLDWTMVPYVRKSFYKHFIDGLHYIEDPLGDEHALNINNKMSIEDIHYKEPYRYAYKYAMDMTIRETHQAVEGMYHNLNTLQSRSGNQLPFTSINYGTCTLPEGRMVTKALLDVSIEGLGALHKTSIFPCGIFQCMKGVNEKPGDPNYDLFRLALQSTAKRLYPNYANVDWSGNRGYDPKDPKTYFSTMGCRTANGFDINAEEGTNPQTKDGRGNICPVTIILPTVAMQARASVADSVDGADLIDTFLEILDKYIHDAKDMLLERFEWICSQPASSAKFMYENHTMMGYHPEEGIRSALKHGTIVIGQLGLAEALQILIGKDHTEPEGMELAKRIEQLFKDRVAEFKQTYRLNFGVYYTPAENLCYTALKKFKEKYGVIENVSDKDFFTNSMHVPVWKHIGPFDKIDIESQLTGYSSAGCITYVELESSVIKNIDALEQVVIYAMEKDVPYFAVNVPNDTCLECGYTGEFNDACPVCGSTHIQQLRRVTGYLTGNYTTAFNLGKQDEVHHRVKHTGYLE